MSESSEFSWGSKESVAFIVSRSPLWVLSPEIALVVAQEEHDLHPSFLGHVFCTKIPLMLCQNPGKRMEKPQWHLTRSDLLQGPKQLSAVFISKKMDQNRNPLPKKDSLWKAYNLHHMKWTLTYLDRLDLKSRYLKISQDISWYLKISQDISRYLKISQGQLSTFAILCHTLPCGYLWVASRYESAQLPMEPWRLLQYHGACPQTSTTQQCNKKVQKDPPKEWQYLCDKCLRMSKVKRLSYSNLHESPCWWSGVKVMSRACEIL